MTTSTITDKLHARADAKLRDFCAQRFGDLFEMCGKHTAPVRPEGSDSLKNLGSQLGIANPEKYPWHGALWAYAEEALFLMLQPSWRDREVTEFMARIDQVSADVAELRDAG